MLRRIIGVTGVSLWAGLIVFALVSGFQSKASGEQMFWNLPEGWKIEESFVVPTDQTAAISLKLGGGISKLTNTVLSREGRSLQVNVIHCPTEKEAERIYEAVLEAHNGLAVAAARDGKLVVEFTKSNDVDFVNQTRLALGFADARLDSVASKIIKKIPEGWQVEKSFTATREQATAIGEKLGGRIENLSNTIFLVEGKKFQVNVIEGATPRAAEAIYDSVLKMKDDPAFCLKYGDTVVEFVGDDVELAKKAVYELGIESAFIEGRAKDLVNALSSGDYEKAVENFDETMKRELPAKKLQGVWDSLIAKLGTFVERVGTREEEIMGYDVIFVTCKFEKGVLDTKVVFDSGKRVAGLFFVPSKGSAKRQPND